MKYVTEDGVTLDYSRRCLSRAAHRIPATSENVLRVRRAVEVFRE